MLPIRRLVLSIDESEFSLRVWQEAQVLARLFKAEIVPVHVTMDDAQSLPGLAKSLGDRLTGAPDLTLSEVHLYRPGMTVAEAVITAAKDHKADLIVLGAGEKSTLDRVFLGSTAEAVSRRAEVPVWVVRPRQRSEELKVILCAVDTSPAARAALQSAIELAEVAGARLVILAVVSTAKPGPDPILVRELELRDMLKELDRAGVDLCVEVVKGADPTREILEEAGRVKADVLVLGQAGREGLSRLWRGNTADALLRQAPCSLVTLHAD